MPSVKVGGEVGVPFEEDGLPTQEVLLQVFELGMIDGKADGRLFHRFRGAEWFGSENSMKMWNAKLAGKPAFTSPCYDGRGQGSIFNRRTLIHRVIYKMVYGGPCPVEIDHKDGNPANNHIDNLLPANTTINMRNRRRFRNNKSGVCGVSFNRAMGKWTVTIGDGTKNKYLGRYATFEEAVAVRKKAEAEYGYSERHGMPAAQPRPTVESLA